MLCHSGGVEQGVTKEGVSPQQLSQAARVTWARVSIESSEKRLEALGPQYMFGFFWGGGGANGSDMSGAQQDRAMTAASLLNGTTALGLHDGDMDTAVFGVLVKFLSFHFDRQCRHETLSECLSV